MKTLQTKAQIASARKALELKGLSFTESLAFKALRRFGLIKRVALGDYLKSWDVLESVQFLTQKLDQSEPILDIGAYSSEIIVALHKLGFKNLTGADLNPNLPRMPFNTEIRYEVTDFMKTSFPSNSFRAITAISVIEHGYDEGRLFSEVSRLLVPGGYFIASFDYWPEKIDTSGISIFGLDWKIFSLKEIDCMIETAERFDLYTDNKLQPECGDRPIEFESRKYTFGWIVFNKRVNS